MVDQSRSQSESAVQQEAKKQNVRYLRYLNVGKNIVQPVRRTWPILVCVALFESLSSLPYPAPGFLLIDEVAQVFCRERS
jgi:hypothetical protein